MWIEKKSHYNSRVSSKLHEGPTKKNRTESRILSFFVSGETKIRCFCGAESCSGYIGSKSKSTADASAPVAQQRSNPRGRKPKLKSSSITNSSSNASSASSTNESEDVCFRCDEGGELLMCSKPKCSKAYHLECVEMKEGECVEMKDHVIYPPQVHLVGNPPHPTRKHILFLNKNISLIREYHMNVYTVKLG